MRNENLRLERGGTGELIAMKPLVRPCAKIREGLPIDPRKRRETNGQEQFVTHDMELQISYRVCAKVPTKDRLWKDRERDRKDTTDAMRKERGRDHRSRGVSRSYTHAGEHTAEIQRIRVYGVHEREKFTHDI